jgi:aspartyl-tRNA(Asn)/glutamyl-tRNA(Gln) amidotransferase subunit B
MNIAKIIANIIINDLLKHAKNKKCKVNQLSISPYDLYWLAELINYDILDRTKVTKIIDCYIEHGDNLKDIITKLNFWPTFDTGKTEKLIDKVIEENPKAVQQIREGNNKAIGFLVGQLKKIDKNIDSKEVVSLLKDKINN